MERLHEIWRGFAHGSRQGLECIFIGNLGKSPGEGTKALVVSHDKFVIVIFVVERYIRFHDVEAFTLDCID